MKWITRQRPKIDRIACPWLIKNFVDNEAQFFYAPADQVKEQAEALGATPFDVPDVEYTHRQDKCTFDYFIEKHKLKDPALQTLASIVRGADTDRHDLASQASGLWAISAGLAFNIKDDYELLKKGMVIYDALYSWARHLQKEKHTQNPVDKIFIDVYDEFIKHKSARKKTPDWVKELKQIIQDQIDTNLNQTEISRSLDINPSYLSREFSKHFDNLSFGEYIRKLRIEKALDQSHFTRIFKQHTGKSPSVYKKQETKGKADTKG